MNVCISTRLNIFPYMAASQCTASYFSWELLWEGMCWCR